MSVVGVDLRRLQRDDEVEQGRLSMARMMAACRRWPSDSDCSLTIIGEEDEVVRAAAEHAASVRGHENTSELREQLRAFPEPA